MIEDVQLRGLVTSIQDNYVRGSGGDPRPTMPLLGHPPGHCFHPGRLCPAPLEIEVLQGLVDRYRTLAGHISGYLYTCRGKRLDTCRWLVQKPHPQEDPATANAGSG